MTESKCRYPVGKLENYVSVETGRVNHMGSVHHGEKEKGLVVAKVRGRLGKSWVKKKKKLEILDQIKTLMGRMELILNN